MGNATFIFDWLQGHLSEYMDCLRALVNVDCGTANKAGVDSVGQLYREWLLAAGADLTDYPLEQYGNCLLAKWYGSGKARLMLLGHLDTVYPDGTAASRPLQLKGNRLLGPGVCDMKAGLLTGLFAIRALQFIHFKDFAEIDFFVNSDEEVDSPVSKHIYQPLVAKMDAALVLEAARENGDIVSARKGCATYRLTVHGRQAHAGVEPEKGANAIVELSHCIQELLQFHQPDTGTTLNVGVIGGGTRSNVVPDLAWAEIDARFTTLQAGRELDAKMNQIAATPVIPSTSIELGGGIQKGPMEKNQATAYLVELAHIAAQELGMIFQDVQTGGTSDGNFTGELGIPTLDGLGPIGGLDHSPGEFLELESIVPRTAMVACLIQAITQHYPQLKELL